MLICLVVPTLAVPLWYLKPKPPEHKTAVVSNKAVTAQQAEKAAKPKAPPKTENPAALLKPDKDTVVFMGVGDMLFDRKVAETIKDEGIDEPFSGVEAILNTGDVIAGNLECPLSLRGTAVPDKDYTFRGLPEAAGGMSNVGINVVSLANNHMMDYGSDALADTIDLLDKAGIAHAGAGMNQEEAYNPVVVSAKGKRVAFFALSSILPDGFWATKRSPGVAGTRLKWSYLKSKITKMADENDFVVVSFHWGIEYQDNPEEYQRDFAKKAIDAGADIVMGHHPHVIQGIEIYKGKLIAYGTGGFIFDHYSRKTGETFILRASLTGNTITKVEVIPIYIDFSGKPRTVTESEATAILDRLKTISEPLGTTLITNETIAEVKLD